MPELVLEELIAALRATPSWQRKREIEVLANELTNSTPLIEGRPVLVGDDAAAIDTGKDYLLLAAEVMYPPLVRADPYLAGKYAILANANDIYAMGGYPLALVDVILATGTEEAAAILRGLRDGCDRYGIALVGGHLTAAGDTTSVAACILGRAKKLLSSFEVQPGDILLHATNLQGQFHPQFRFWNCSAHLSGPELRRDLSILPAIAEAGWCRAARDVSMGGIFGSMLMLLELAGLGAIIDLETVPQPPGIEDRYLDWLLAFPSYGFILATPSEHVADIQAAFSAQQITCAAIGQATVDRRVVLRLPNREATLWDLAAGPFIGFSIPSTQTV
jgi:AIR synthase-related protein